MASDGQFTYYNDGFGGSGTIYKLNSSGDVVASFNPSDGDGDIYTGLAYLDGMLYATSLYGNFIDVYNASTFAYVTTLQTGIGDSSLVGLAGDPQTGMLYAVGQVGFETGELYEINPSTGAVVNEAPDNNAVGYEQDMAYADGLLIVSETDGPGANALAEYDPGTFGYVTTVYPPYAGDASGLAGDGLSGGTGDWFSFNVNAGDNLAITTTTPGDTSGDGGQFANDLDPDAQPLRCQRQPGRHRDRQRRRWAQRRHRLDGPHARATTWCRSWAPARPTWASTPSASRAPRAASRRSR